jgi:Uma2 family endonuclease
MSDQVRKRAIVRVQNPVVLGCDTEPQPDITLLRRREDFYAGTAPGPADVLLIIEVLESSAGDDRRVNLPLYARAGIPKVWLVDLHNDVVEVHRQPGAAGYRHVARHGRETVVSAQAWADLKIAVSEILG